MNIASFLVLAGGALLLSLLAALMSATQAAYQISARATLEQYCDSETNFGKRMKKIVSDLEIHLSVVSFTQIFAESLAAMLLVVAFLQIFNAGWVVALAATIFIGFLSFFVVAVGPKTYGQIYSLSVIKLSAPIIRMLRIILGPIAKIAQSISSKKSAQIYELDEKVKNEQLLSLVDRAAEQDLLEEEEQDIIHSVVEFGDTIVREVMVPRTDMVTVSSSDSIRQAFEELLRSRFSRIPVKASDSDDIVGVAYLRDLAGYIYRKSEESAAQTVTRIMKPPQFVPDLQRADELLRLMQHQANHLALVVDEHGGIAGLVTMEDLIEELVGEISDEHDKQNPEFTKLVDGSFIVDAKLEIEKFGNLFNIVIEDEEAQTVSGLVAKTLGRLPGEQDGVIVEGIEISVLGYEKKRQKVVTYVAKRLKEDQVVAEGE